ncbi:MAG: RluA family pseudouridine synthase [Solirubrobacterales bacterium]
MTVMTTKLNRLTYIVEFGTPYTFLREVITRELRLSQGLQTRLKKANHIRVNGEPTLTNYRLCPGDVVTVDLEFAEANQILPEAIPIDILYADQDITIVDKPPGMPIHPSKHGGFGTLANAMTYHWQRQGEERLFRPVNRLDRDTSGLVLIANSHYAHQALFVQQRNGQISREYFAIAQGFPPEASGRIDAPIARFNQYGRKRIVSPEGQPAVTNYQVLKRFKTCSYLTLRLETGRTHQIRVHLQSLGCPILGDTLYGSFSPLIGRQALHAGYLVFDHPRTGEPLRFTAPFPDDMREVLDNLLPDDNPR